MDTNTREYQPFLPVKQEIEGNVFWCEMVSFIPKAGPIPSSDPPCEADPGDCSACNGNPDCSHGCA